MLMSCKCLNFVATSSNSVPADEDSNNNPAAAITQTFFQKYTRNFVFYSPCMDFFKQSIGPIDDLTINALNQRDLLYSLTLDVPPVPPTISPSTWQLTICVNCKTVLCAKRLHIVATVDVSRTQQQQPQHPHPHPQQQQQQYLINSALLTSNDELTRRRIDKSYSEAFSLLIMDHPEAKTPTTPPTPQSVNSFNNFTVQESKQQRLRQLQNSMQQRLKREIAETDERIQRYTEQQFALLKSFREKSEQECDLLARLIQQVPEQQNGEWFLDRFPPAWEVNSNATLSYASRRRNTISSRRDLNTATTTSATAPTTPTTPSVNANTANAMITNQLNFPTAATVAPNCAINGNAQGNANNNTNNNNSSNGNGNGNGNGNTVVARKMSNFDTPPATPEATPMSVGNSPTFKQQQQQQMPTQTQQQQNRAQMPPQSLPATQMSFQQQFPTPTTETSDDCIFELEDVVEAPMPSAAITPQQQQQQQLQQQQQQYQRSFSHPLAQQLQRESNNTHYMSDLDELEGDAEEAEDALDMDSSVAIPMNASRYRSNPDNNNTSSMLDYAKSLPIQIANTPSTPGGMGMTRFNLPLADDDIDSTVDIAASIKALAKSVHGEAVFGDLPRPRLRSQI